MILQRIFLTVWILSILKCGVEGFKVTVGGCPTRRIMQREESIILTCSAPNGCHQNNRSKRLQWIRELYSAEGDLLNNETSDVHVYRGDYTCQARTLSTQLNLTLSDEVAYVHVQCKGKYAEPGSQFDSFSKGCLITSKPSCIESSEVETTVHTMKRTSSEISSTNNAVKVTGEHFYLILISMFCLYFFAFT